MYMKKSDTRRMRCCLCGDDIEEWPGGGSYGHNPDPLGDDDRCCDTCNGTKVLPARLRMFLDAQSGKPTQ